MSLLTHRHTHGRIDFEVNVQYHSRHDMGRVTSLLTHTHIERHIDLEVKGSVAHLARHGACNITVDTHTERGAYIMRSRVQ